MFAIVEEACTAANGTPQVHFHMIPKPNLQEGLGIGWPAQSTDMDKLKALHEELKAKM